MFNIHRQFGNLGEDIACRFLKNKSYALLDRNYLKPWGEIDIVAKQSGKIAFIEVKTVSCEMSVGDSKNVTHETAHKDDFDTRESYRPEDNVHPAKLSRLSRTIQSYLLEKGVEDEWQFDVITVRLDRKRKLARVEHIKDIII